VDPNLNRDEFSLRGAVTTIQWLTAQHQRQKNRRFFKTSQDLQNRIQQWQSTLKPPTW